ncbi:MAG: FG-GAP-like repeat-containing protein [Nitrospirota bacterium]
MGSRWWRSVVFLPSFLPSFLLSLLAIFFSPPDLARAEGVIPIEGKGSVAGNSGAFSYAIPIAVSPGRHGLAPNLALAYNSSGGNGMLGVGWDLPIGYVMRSTRHGVDYTCNAGANCFVFMLGEASSELVERDDWCNGCYGAKVEGAFIKFEFSGGYWESTDKAGTKYRFGYTAASRQDGTPGVFKWALDRVEDTNGNYMTYTYVKDQGQLYPDRIDYTGHTSGLATTNFVKFYYDTTRLDAPTMYDTNFAVVTAWRLKTIDVWGGGSRVRAYKLLYDVGDSTRRSVLTGVQPYGKDATLDASGTVTGGTGLPQWYLYQPEVAWGFTENAVWAGPSSEVQDTALGDYNGDGRTDMAAYTSGVNWNVCVSTGSGFACSVWAGIDGLQGDYRQLGDFNGDGKTDMAAPVSGSNWNVCLSTGGAFACSVWAGTGSPGWYNPIVVGDFNGDGKTDMARYGGSASWTVCLSTGSGFACDYWRAVSHYSSSQNEVRDLNGDGKTDLVEQRSAGDFIVCLSTGSGFTCVQNSQWDPAGGGGDAWGDFNGDGKTDTAKDLGYGGWWNVCLSTGSSFACSGWVAVDGASPSNTVWGDYNGDGKTDMATYASGYWNVCHSTGSDFLCASRWGSGDVTGIATGDFDGDGKTDKADYAGGGAWNIARPSSLAPDLLQGIALDFRGSTSIPYYPPSPQSTITYAPSTRYANTHLPFPVQIVSAISTSDGNGNTSVTTYTYAGGFHHLGDRDFRGFNYVKAMGPLGPSNEQTITETWFHQGNDVAVDVNNPNVADGYMSGRPYRVRVSDASGTVHSETTTSYVADSSAPYFNPPAQVLTATALCSGSPCGKRSQTDYVSYDAYGNLTEERHSGDIGTTSDDLTVARTFYPDDLPADPWIMGLPATETVYKGLGTGGTKMAETRFYYDNRALTANPVKGNLTKLERWLNPGSTYLATTMVYDSYGNLTTTTDAKGSVTSQCYDASATFVQRVTNPLSQQTKTDYYGVSWNAGCGGAPTAFTGSGSYGQVKTVTDPNNVQVKTEYDALGRVTKVTQPDGSWASTAYVGFGDGMYVQHVRTDTSAGLSTWTYFDALGRTIRQRSSGPDSNIIVTDIQYDSRGAVRQTSLPYFETIESASGRWTTTSYDALGRVVRRDFPDGTRTLACYSDWVAVSIDANNHHRREALDASGRVIEVNEYAGTFSTCDTSLGTPYATTTYEYDVVGNLVKVTDAKNNRTTMRYDSLGRKIGMADPDMGSCGDLTTLAPAASYPWYASPCWTYKYDNNGNLESQRDAKNQTIWFQYDNINRLRQKDYNTPKSLGSGDVRYTYDTVPSGFTSPPTYYQVGRLSQVVDSSGTARFGYDSLGRTLRADKIVGATTYTTKTTYDALGRVATLTYPDNSTVSYEYNGPLLKRVYEGATNYAQFFGYSALGQPGSVTYGNGVATAYTYANTGNTTPGCTTNTFLLCTLVTGAAQNLTYGYDPGGNVTNMTDTAPGSVIGTQSFTYDALNRLATATGPYGTGGAQATLTYAYNEIGNIICNPQISTCSAGSPNYTYPASGPSSVRPHAVTQAGAMVYGYDANGNMTSGPSKTLVYDHENRPTTITVSGVTTTFVYDGDGGRVKKTVGGVTTTYIGQLYECTTSCSKYIFAGSQRLALKPNGTTGTIYYYHTDHLGSSSVVTDQTGAVVERLGYHPYGQVRTNTGSVDVNHKFTGQRLDDSTGLYFYNARYYDPVLGRFLRPDPLTYDHYMYVGNNPINATDPSGYQTICRSVNGEMYCNGTYVPPSTSSGGGSGSGSTSTGGSQPSGGGTGSSSGSTGGGGSSSGSTGGGSAGLGLPDPSLTNPPSWAYAFPPGVNPGPMGPVNTPGLSITQHQVVIIGTDVTGGSGGVAGSGSSTVQVSGYEAFQSYYDPGLYAMLVALDPGGFWSIPKTTNTTFVLSPGDPVQWPSDPFEAERAARIEAMSNALYERNRVANTDFGGSCVTGTGCTLMGLIAFAGDLGLYRLTLIGSYRGPLEFSATFPSPNYGSLFTTRLGPGQHTAEMSSHLFPVPPPGIYGERGGYIDVNHGGAISRIGGYNPDPKMGVLPAQ